MSEWNVNLPDVTSCKLGSSQVSNIYDKVGSQYRLLWPHPGVTIETDISSSCSFTWDSINIDKTYEEASGYFYGSSQYQGTTYATYSNLYQTAFNATLYNLSESVFKAGTYNCTCQTVGDVVVEHPVTEVSLSDLTSVYVSYGRDGYKHKIGVSAINNGSGYDHTGEGYYDVCTRAKYFKLDNVTCTWIDKSTLTSTITCTGSITVTDTYTGGMDTPDAKLDNGESFGFWDYVRDEGFPHDGVSLDDYSLESVDVSVATLTDISMVTWHSYTATTDHTGSVTLASDVPYDPNYIFEYSMSPTITGAASNLSFSPIKIYSPHGKLNASVSPVSGTATLAGGVPEGYSVYTTDEQYTLKINNNGATASIITTDNGASWNHTGYSTTRSASDYSFTPYTYTSTDSTETDPTIVSTTVTTMTTKKKVDYI